MGMRKQTKEEKREKREWEIRKEEAVNRVFSSG